jgi:MFS family permease
VWAAPENIKGRLMGIFWGIVRVGSAVSVVLGGFFYDQFSYTAAVGAVAILTALSIPAALAVRWPKTQFVPKEERTTALEGLKLALKTAPRRWILTVGFMDTLFEGMLVSTLSLYLFNRLGTRIEDSLFGIGTLAGTLIAVRYISNILFSPVLGSISDKVGQAGMLIILSVISLGGISGLVSLNGTWMVTCLIPVFMSGAGIFATMNAASCELGEQTERPHLFVGAFSTAIDAGAAVSPLLAFSIAEIFGFETLYLFAVSLLVIACVRFWQTMKV